MAESNAPESIGHLNYNEVIVLTQIMTVNGDIPADCGGWKSNSDYVGGHQRENGVLGECDYDDQGTAYVCVRACLGLSLPNTHPDYVPVLPPRWVIVPQFQSIDWRYVPQQYHRREGWRLLKKDRS